AREENSVAREQGGDRAEHASGFGADDGRLGHAAGVNIRAEVFGAGCAPDSRGMPLDAQRATIENEDARVAIFSLGYEGLGDRVPHLGDRLDDLEHVVGLGSADPKHALPTRAREWLEDRARWT